MVLVEAVELYLSKGDYKNALNNALEIDDPVKRLLALTEVLTAFPREEVLAHMLDALESTEGTPEKALAYSILGRALYILDRDGDAEAYFDNAIALAGTIGSPRVRGEVLAGIARNLVLSDRYGDALELFREAVELLQASRGLSSAATSSLIKAARLIEKSADEIPNEKALDFYGLAREVYSSIFFKLQAKYLEDKMELIRDVLKRGKVAIEELLEKGEVELAIEMMRFLPLESRAISMLELAYWLFLHEQPRLGRRVFDDALEIVFVGKFKPSDRELEGIARRFLRIGFLEEPLILAGVIKDEKLSSELLGEVAMAYSRWGDTAKARSIAEGIRDESVKRRVLEALEGGDNVGYEQGLPLTGGGEERGAVSEDDRAREVQGEVEQEGGTAAGEGDDSGDTGDEVQLR
ncbi:tetratricopeptide repeat protein [Thermococcus siculi]|uniref:tetratricopeptide repeat protein n=1 Tax=Thermococcus siculi TaxID=72803 RepID=UPI001E55B220|nr:tetratricopeptide repeat protein [Thermococcus siculi]